MDEKHAALRLRVQNDLEEMGLNASEFDALVEYNLESGLDLLSRPEDLKTADDVRSEIIEGLERALRQIEEMTERSRGIALSITENQKAGIGSFQEQIRALSQNEKLFELKLRLAKAKTVDQARTYRQNFSDKARETALATRSILENRWGKLKFYYAKMRGFAGLPSATAEGEESLSRFVIENRKKFSELPYVYQRLFRVEALADQRFFEGQNTHLAALKISFEAWRNGEPGITVIVGEKGSGRTSLINAASPKIYNPLPFFRIGLQMRRPVSEAALLEALNEAFKLSETSTFDALENKILSDKERKMICLEDIQNLFLRTVDGFDTLERFLLFMSRTCGTIYWLNTCTLYSWRYLEKAIAIAQFYQQPHFLDRLSREEIETIILKRHRVSGYRLLFEAAETDTTTKKQAKGADPQERLRTSFFNRLAALAGGNISVALLFWLAAIRKIENQTLTVAPDLKVDPSTLFRISNDELFSLAALLHHERLNGEEPVGIFRLEQQQSLILLDRMEKKGIVVRTPEAYYQINPIFYRPIVHALISSIEKAVYRKTASSFCSGFLGPLFLAPATALGTKSRRAPLQYPTGRRKGLDTVDGKGGLVFRCSAHRMDGDYLPLEISQSRRRTLDFLSPADQTGHSDFAGGRMDPRSLFRRGRCARPAHSNIGCADGRRRYRRGIRLAGHP